MYRTSCRRPEFDARIVPYVYAVLPGAAFWKAALLKNPPPRKPFWNTPFWVKPFEKNPFEKKPLEKNPFEKKPLEKKPFEKKPLEKNPFEKNPFEKKPFELRPFEKNPLFRVTAWRVVAVVSGGVVDAVHPATTAEAPVSTPPTRSAHRDFRTAMSTFPDDPHMGPKHRPYWPDPVGSMSKSSGFLMLLVVSWSLCWLLHRCRSPQAADAATRSQHSGNPRVRYARLVGLVYAPALWKCYRSD